MTLMVLRDTVFKITENWQVHAKTDMQKRLASVHSKVGRGSLIPQPSINVRGAVQINKQAKGMNPYLYSGIDSKTTTSVFASIH